MLHKRNKVLMFHDAVNKNNGSYLKHSKYGAFAIYKIFFLSSCLEWLK
jgi:hypothetical protein